MLSHYSQQRKTNHVVVKLVAVCPDMFLNVLFLHRYRMKVNILICDAKRSSFGCEFSAFISIHFRPFLFIGHIPTELLIELLDYPFWQMLLLLRQAY